ncbi:MAG: IS110 family transposase [Thermoplasmata archaeon]|nr:IS110 family transposase [Thermoplasmata archaeon]
MERETSDLSRPCVGLDVHRNSITATYLDPRGSSKRTWTFPTTRSALAVMSKELGKKVPVVLEASTSGKAVAELLKEAGHELPMAAPAKVALIAQADVKTDERDSEALAHLYQAGFLPECYIPPPEIDRLRQLVRQRQDLGSKVAGFKNQVHALITRNLLESEMNRFSDWFGVSGIRAMVRLPLPVEHRAMLGRSLRQIRLLVEHEEELQREMARIAVDREDARLLMTIPGIDYYSALAIVAEIGEVERFSNKQHLASYAGLVPRADNSGEKVSSHRGVKGGDRVLKAFLCIAVQGLIRTNRDTSIKRFYEKKAKQIGAAKAQIAAARKLSAVIWHMLTYQHPYAEQDEVLTVRKAGNVERVARRPSMTMSAAAVEQEAEQLLTKADVLARMGQEAMDLG